jgi:hypothetical protein
MVGVLMAAQVLSLAAHAVVDAVAAADLAVDELAGADLVSLDDDALQQLLIGAERLARRVSSAGLRVFHEASERGLYARRGYASPSAMLVGLLNLSRHEAKLRVHNDFHLSPRLQPSGGVRPPRRPHVAEALAGGSIGTSHVRAVLDIIDDAPTHATSEDVDELEKALVAVAELFEPSVVRSVGTELLARLDPDGDPGDERLRRKRRGITVGQQDDKLMSKIGGELSPTARAYLDVLLDTWARPGMNNPDDPVSPIGAYADADPDVVKVCASRDLRTPAQCRHDALEAMLKHFAESGHLGDSHRGLPATVVLTMTLEQLEAATGQNVDPTPTRSPRQGTAPGGGASADEGVPKPDSTADSADTGSGRLPSGAAAATTDAPPAPDIPAIAADGPFHALPDPFGQSATPPEVRAARQPVRTASGTLIPIKDALTIAEQAHPVLVIFDHTGVPLHFGNTKRLASRAQRLALLPNHRGCTHPGCTKPATWTQIHHTREWAAVHRTNVDELAPACEEHHALVHDRPNGWATHIITSGPDAGRCAWTPPKTVDPQRRPRINRVHHPEEMCQGISEAVRQDCGG